MDDEGGRHPPSSWHVSGNAIYGAMEVRDRNQSQRGPCRMQRGSCRIAAAADQLPAKSHKQFRKDLYNSN